MGSHPHNRHLQHSNNVSICCTLIGFPLQRLYLLYPCAICSVSSALEIRIYKWQTRRWWQFSRSCCVLVRFLLFLLQSPKRNVQCVIITKTYISNLGKQIDDRFPLIYLPCLILIYFLLAYFIDLTPRNIVV
jgi:hypothetical protein